MKIIVLVLFLIPAIANAFQSDIEIGYAISDIDSDSDTSLYTIGYRHYAHTMNYGSAPFKEQSFLSSINTFELLFAYVDYDFGFVDADGTILGAEAIIYQEKIALDISFLSSSVSVNGGGSLDSEALTIEPGYRIDDNSLVFGIYRNISIETQDIVSYGVGYKIVLSNLNLVAEYTSTTEEDSFEKINVDSLGILGEYYITYDQYFGFKFERESTDGINEDTDVLTISFGGLIDRKYKYEVSYENESSSIGDDATTISVLLGMGF